MIRKKTLSIEEALEYISFAVWQRDSPEDFEGEITCELNDDGSVEVYFSSKDEEIDIETN